VATVGGTRALYSAQLAFKDAFNAALLPAVEQAQGILISSASSDGTIDPRKLPDIQKRVGDTIQRVFVGNDLRNPYTPDTTIPLAPYPRLLNQAIAGATFAVVLSHYRYMKRQLPEDIQQWLARAPVQEQIRTNPLAQYESAHTWVDPSGYRLSDRIWQTSLRTRMKIDALLADGIRNGVSATDLAKTLARFLLPNRADLRTNKPYGRNAAFDAMRLARTEIARAHGQASKAAAIANPFVDFSDYHLSSRHPRVDVCDTIASVGMNGERLRNPYPVEECPVPVASTHPQCLCYITPVVTKTPSQVADELRQQMQQGKHPPLTPFHWRGMLGVMLGAYLFQEFVVGMS
jgi:hypothetical protein